MTGTKRKGTYLLFLMFRNPAELNAGSLGKLFLNAGEYCYTGSAMNGLDNRIERHLKREKKVRWHIDNLTICADDIEAYMSLDPVPECILSRTASECGCTPVFKGFGCSDCRCATHLFFVNEVSKQKLLNATGAVPFLKNNV